MRFLLISCVIFFTSFTAKGQQNIKFFSQNYMGMLEGESATSFQLQTINGFRYKTWFTGIGTGLDYYFQRSIPLFLSAGNFLSASKVPLYFNGDIGINFPWGKNEQYFIHDPADFSPSLYWAGGVGYAFRFPKTMNRLLLNLGYSYKHLVEKTKLSAPCLIPPCPEYTERYDYRLKRLSLRAGWMF